MDKEYIQHSNKASLLKLKVETVNFKTYIWSTGVSLQPGQFYVKLFSAEDIPQMDSDKLAAITNFFSSEVGIHLFMSINDQQLST